MKNTISDYSNLKEKASFIKGYMEGVLAEKADFMETEKMERRIKLNKKDIDKIYTILNK